MKADDTELWARVEALLFSARAAVDVPTLARLLRESRTSIRTALVELERRYDAMGGAIEVREGESGHQMRVRPEHTGATCGLLPVQLSPSCLETLSTIAVNQPILQSDLVHRLGSSVYDHVNRLLEAELISKSPRTPSYELRTTATFARHFQVDDDPKAIGEAIVKRRRRRAR